MTVFFALIAGPKILLLFPIWILGVFVYFFHQKIVWNKTVSFCFAFVPLILYFFYRQFSVPNYFVEKLIGISNKTFVNDSLYWSKFFISDYLLGILISAHLLGVSSFIKNGSCPVKVDKIIRFLAGSTFSLYLFHYPLLMFFGTIFTKGYIISFTTIGTVILLSFITERKKLVWKKLFDAIFMLVSRQIFFLKKLLYLKFFLGRNIITKNKLAN